MADAGLAIVETTTVDLNMAYYFAIVPARSPELAQAELNAFLRGHRVLTVDRRWVELGENSYWAICVDYLEPGGAGAGPQPKNGARGKIDYRERLSPEDFSVFAKLRQMRKEIAQAEAVPVYMVFTNEQLAQMVQSRVTTKEAMEQIEGVGDARIEKYGPRLLEHLKQQWDGGSPGEAGRTPF